MRRHPARIAIPNIEPARWESNNPIPSSLVDQTGLAAAKVTDDLQFSIEQLVHAA